MASFASELLRVQLRWKCRLRRRGWVFCGYAEADGHVEGRGLNVDRATGQLGVASSPTVASCPSAALDIIIAMPKQQTAAHCRVCLRASSVPPPFRSRCAVSTIPCPECSVCREGGGLFGGPRRLRGWRECPSRAGRRGRPVLVSPMFAACGGWAGKKSDKRFRAVTVGRAPCCRACLWGRLG